MDDAWSESISWTWSHTDRLCSSTLSGWECNKLIPDFGLCDLWGDVRKNKSLYLEGKHKVSRVMKRTKVHCGSGAVKMVMEWQKDNNGISLSRKAQEKYSKKLMMDFFSVPFKSCTHTCTTIQNIDIFIKAHNLSVPWFVLWITCHEYILQMQDSTVRVTTSERFSEHHFLVQSIRFWLSEVLGSSQKAYHI